MSTKTTVLATAALTLATSMGVQTLAQRDADAGVRVRVGGRAHVRVGGPRVRVRAPRVRVRVHRPAPPPVRVRVGGSIYVGVGWYHRTRFAAPPPPAVYDDCNCGGDYYPVAPAPTVGVAAAAYTRPELPRWGLGVAAGGVDVQGEAAGDDLALIGRFRMTPGLSLEGELGKSELADGSRVDRRLGASLVWELSPYNRWSPYVVGGLGVTQVEVGDDVYETSQEFGEVGVGLRWAVTPKLHLGADIRAGSRSASEDAMPLDAAYRAVTPPTDESEEYTRARLSGVLFF